MTQITSVVLADAQEVPVDHTFYPDRYAFVNNESVADMIDRSAAAAVGFWRLSYTFSRPSKSRDAYRCGVVLKLPVLANITNSTVTGIAPAPAIAYVPHGISDFVIPTQSTALIRQSLRKMFYNIHAAGTPAAKMVEDLDAPFF